MSKVYDWELIEKEYRIGIKSLREIASEYGCSEGYIRKVAKKEGWVKDLGEKIRARANHIVRTRTQEYASIATERQIIESVAGTQATIQIKHRSRVDSYQELCEVLFAEICEQSVNVDDFKKLGELLRSEDKNGFDKLNEIYRKVIETPARVESFKKLSDSFKNLVALERQIHGISDNANGDADKEPLTEIRRVIMYKKSAESQ